MSDDPFKELYPTSTIAFHAGEQRGQDDALRHAISRLSLVSVKHETAGNDAAFHAAEECIATVVKLRAILQSEWAAKKLPPQSPLKDSEGDGV